MKEEKLKFMESFTLKIMQMSAMLKKVKKEECRRFPNEKKIRMSDIKKLLHDVQNSVCNLLIG